MKKNILMVFLLLLFSCSNENASETSSSCTMNTATDTPVSANSIQVLIVTGDQNLPLQGVAIQLDHDGLCFATDEKGFVRFDGVDSNKHDVHVFGNPGYHWASRYRVDASNGQKITFKIDKLNNQLVPDTVSYSYVNIKANIFNSSVDGRITSSYKSTVFNSYFDAEVVNKIKTSYSNSYQFSKPEGTELENEIWFFDKARKTNGDYVLTDAYRVPTFTTVTTSNSGLVNTFDVQFQPIQSKPQLSRLLTFSELNYPVGFTFSYVDIKAAFPSTAFPKINHGVRLFLRMNRTNLPVTLTNTSTLEAFTTPFGFTNLSIVLSAKVNANLDYPVWNYFSNKYLLGTVGVNINPRITNIPSFYASQKNGTITWSSIAAPISFMNLVISNNFKKIGKLWNITIMGNLSEISLPQLPAGVIPVLKSGAEYNVRLYGQLNYLQDNTSQTIFEMEDFVIQNKWTR